MRSFYVFILLTVSSLGISDNNINLNSNRDNFLNIDVKASINKNELSIRILNLSDREVSINRGFAHRHNITLVLIENIGFGEKIGEEILFSDPDIGQYRLDINEEVTEKFDLSKSFPEIEKTKGSYFLFWTTNVVLNDLDLSKFSKKRYGGFFELEFPPKH